MYSCPCWFTYHYTIFFRSSPRRWPSRLELRYTCPSVRTSVRTSTKSFSDFHSIWCVGRPRPHMRTSMTWPDIRSRSRSFRSCEKCTFLGLSPPPFQRGAQNWWLVAIVWDLYYSLSEPDFWITIQESYHKSSNFVQYRYLTTFKWPYFGSAWHYSHVVEHVGSPTCTVYVDMTLTWSKVKVKVTEHLNFRQLPITAHF